MSSHIPFLPRPVLFLLQTALVPRQDRPQAGRGPSLALGWTLKVLLGRMGRPQPVEAADLKVGSYSKQGCSGTRASTPIGGAVRAHLPPPQTRVHICHHLQLNRDLGKWRQSGGTWGSLLLTGCKDLLCLYLSLPLSLPFSPSPSLSLPLSFSPSLSLPLPLPFSLSFPLSLLPLLPSLRGRLRLRGFHT